MVLEGANEIADSTQVALGLSVKGTVVAEPTPVWYSPHPYTELHVPARVYPAPAVREPRGGAVSEFPITSELVAGVNDVTEEVVEPAEELPVEDW